MFVVVVVIIIIIIVVVAVVCSSKYQYPWIADHQKVDTFEAFREMISQRLSQVNNVMQITTVLSNYINC